MVETFTHLSIVAPLPLSPFLAHLILTLTHVLGSWMVMIALMTEMTMTEPVLLKETV